MSSLPSVSSAPIGLLSVPDELKEVIASHLPLIVSGWTQKTLAPVRLSPDRKSVLALATTCKDLRRALWTRRLCPGDGPALAMLLHIRKACLNCAPPLAPAFFAAWLRHDSILRVFRNGA